MKAQAVAKPKPAVKPAAREAAPARQARTGAEVVSWMRGDPRSPLPHREAAERLFGRSFEGVETYRGGRAAVACDELGARAFAVGNIVAFAESDPALPRVVHELAHVVQQGRGGPLPSTLGVSDPASAPEREAVAASRGASETVSRAPVQIYRDTDPDTDEAELTTVLEKRLLKVMKAAVEGTADPLLKMTDWAKDTAPFGVRNSTWFAPVFKTTSAGAWTREQYAGAAAAKAETAGSDLADAFKTTDPTRPPLANKGFVISQQRLRLVRIGEAGKPHKSYAFIGTTDIDGVAADWQPQIQDMRTEQRMVAFATSPTFELVTGQADKDAAFGLRKPGEKLPYYYVKSSSKEPFSLDKYFDVLQKANRLPNDGSGKAVAAADLETFRTEAFAKRGVPTPKGRAYVVPVVEAGADKKLFYYALLGEYQKEVHLADPASLKTKTAPAALLAEYKATFIKKLREINDGTTKKINGKDVELIEKAADVVTALKALEAKIDEALQKVADAKADPTTKTAPTDGELEDLAGTIREGFVKAVVDAYDDIDALHQQVGVARIFPGDMEKIRGTILEDWVANRYKNVEADPKHIPVFGKKDGDKLAQSEQLQKLRRGDGSIEIQDEKRVIFEAKFVTGAPTDEHIKQMKDYARILGWDGQKKVKPLSAWFYDKSKQPDQRWSEHSDWAGVFYVFSSKEIRDLWIDPLKAAFGEIYALKVRAEFAGDLDADKIVTGWSENPTIEITIDKPGDRTEFTFPPFSAPEPKQPGVELKSVQLTLAGPGDPSIVKGTVTTVLDESALKGVVSSPQPTTRSIQPLTDSERIDQIGKSTKGKPKIFGHVTEKITGLKSKLDDLLKRVKTSARLIDGGVEASLDVEPGTSGIPGFKLLEAGVTVRLGKGQGKHGLSVDGKAALEHTSGKIAGGLTISYKDRLLIEGTATVKNLIEGVKPFTVAVSYSPAAEEGTKPEIKIWTKDPLAFEKRYRGVLITGSASATYDVESSTFSGTGELNADLGALGKASVKDVKIVENKLDAATFKYDSPPLAWPKKNPTLAMKVDGTVTFDKGEFSGGGLGVVATITHKSLKALNPKLEAITLEGHIDIDKEGKTSGSIKSKTIIPLGKHFQIPELEIKLTADGEVSSTFTVDLINIETSWVKLNDASISCVIDRDGFRVTKGKIEAEIGSKGKKFHGKLYASYDPAVGFSLSAEVDFIVKPGLVAHGWLRYESKTETINAKLSTDPIPLLKPKPGSIPLFTLNKQIRLFGIPFVVGLYLDVGLDFNFKYSFELNVTPTVELIDFSLADFSFKEVAATMVLDGDIWASLEPTPKIGLGGYLIDPLVLRGGGGLMIPISAKARLVPKGTFYVKYSPTGGLTGGASVGLALKFGITGAVTPYAEFVLLDGVYKASWTADSPLASFTILPERDLFTFKVDFGKSLEENDNPELPKKSQPSVPPAGTKQVGESKQEGSKPVQREQTADKPGVNPGDVHDEEAGNQEGFSMKMLVDKLMETPPGQAIKSLIETVKETYEFIKGIVGKIWKAIKRFVGDTIDVFRNFVKGVKEAGGVFAYIKQLLKDHLDETLFYVIEPVLDSFAESEKKLLDMFEKMPSNPFDMVIHIIKSLFGIAWDSLTSLVGAIKTMIERGIDVAGRFLNHLIKQGKLGVLHHPYYLGSKTLHTTYDFDAPDQYKIHVGIDDHDKNRGSTLVGVSSGIAFGLWEALKLFRPRVEYTKNPELGSGDADNFWVGPDEDPD